MVRGTSARARRVEWTPGQSRAGRGGRANIVSCQRGSEPCMHMGRAPALT
jgi:hypothetical protein